MQRVGIVLGTVGLSLAATVGLASQASAGEGNPGTSHSDRIGEVTFQYSYATQWLNIGGKWPFGKVYLTMQSDGNLVMYKNSGGVAWASNTARSGATKMLFQTDGNLVLYKSDGRTAVWSSRTANKCTAPNASPVIALQSDSNFVIYCKNPVMTMRPKFEVVWATNTSGL